MIFTSFEFFVLLSIVLVGISVLQRGDRQQCLLLFASYLFYGWWNWRFCFLILFTSSVDFLCGKAIWTSNPRRAKNFVALSAVVNLGVLVYFKYAGFFSESLEKLLLQLGIVLPNYFVDAILPVGISFYTFQSMSYVVDVYRRKIAPTKRFVEYALFVSFFPQLVAGPIMRASVLLPQLQKTLSIVPENWSRGLRFLLTGLVVKLIVADNLSSYVDIVYAAPETATGPQLFLATFFFTFQIYGDFLGYSLMAIGVARMLGIRLNKNFDCPYASLSMSEFWRRWHITLGGWFRDYVYFPLGGSRNPRRARLAFNLFLVFALSGLWHGANWTFVAWGVGHGLLVAAEKLGVEKVIASTPIVVRRAYVLSAVVLLWVFFRANTVQDAFIVLERSFVDFSFSGLTLTYGRSKVLVFCLVCVGWLISEILWNQWTDFQAFVVKGWESTPSFRCLAYVTASVCLLLLGNWGEKPFIYFQF